MTATALVAYATKHGSTAEIAEAVAEGLREAGVEVDVRPAKDVLDVSGYRLVVVGSAVYMNRWRDDGIGFLKRFEAELATRPTWLFSSGPTGGTPDAEAKAAELLAAQPPAPGEAGKRAARIGVRGHATFGGAVGDGMTGLLERWMPKGDWRDLGAVRAWGRQIGEAAAGG